MSGGGRADPFADFDVEGFTPAKPPAKGSPEAIRKLAEKASFPSREAAPALTPKAEGQGARPERRIYRTGRTAHFACKADPKVVAEFYDICDSQDWVMGKTLERAVEALKRELADQKTHPPA
jgi:hypothetical protein